MTSVTAPFEGWAAIYDAQDLSGDVIAPGAFAKSLRKRGAGDVRLLYQHGAGQPIGRWLEFIERPKGLYARGELVLSAASGREVYELIRHRALDGLSIGYRTVAARKDRSGQRRILQAELWEVSIVTFPMAPGARIARIGAPSDPRGAAPVAAAEEVPPPSSAATSSGALAVTLRGAAAILSMCKE